MDAALRDLARTIESGEATLFTGAGFSSDARDLDGRTLPDSTQMLRELWELVFGADDPDDSTLPDLYDVALARAPDELRGYIARRLRIGDAPLPPHYAAWFSAPWRRIYTLNIDDLEVAVQRQFALPHRLRSVSPLAAADRAPAAPAQDATIDVVHLNGLAGADATELTFSTLQYAARLCARDREYERLASDLEQSSFVFAGTTLDEVILWQHLELHRRRTGDEPVRGPSFLVTASLSRARQVLLETLRVRWVKATIAEVAGWLPRVSVTG